MQKNSAVSEIYNKNIFCSRSDPARLFNMPNAHHHNHYEIYYLLSGKRNYFIGNQIYNVNKGDIVLISKGVLHKTVVAEDPAHQRLLISFNDSMIYPQFQEDINQCFSGCFYHVPPALSGKTERLMLEIEKEYQKNDRFSEQLIRGMLMDLFAFLVRFADKFASEQPEIKPHSQVQQAAAYISENYGQDIRLKEVAKIFAVSPEHLSRTFKKITGFNFNEYITLVRIVQAEKLLLSSRRSVMEIALICGFNDSNYFSVVFKKIKGISPNQYRKTYL